MTSRARHLVTCTLALLALAAGACAATAAELSVTRVDMSSFPTMRVGLYSPSITSEQPLPALGVVENGRHAGGVTAFRGRIGQVQNSASASIMIALDTSNSMSGDKIAHAVEAARVIVDSAGPNDTVGLVGFDGSVETLVAPTTDRPRVMDALASIKLGEGTRLFDGVVRAATIADVGADNRVVVVVSDGQDSGSKNSLDDATAAARRVGVNVFTVGIDLGSFNASDLQKLALESGGAPAVVKSAERLPDTFRTLSRELLGGFWIEYTSMLPQDSVGSIGVTTGGQLAAATAIRTPKASDIAGPREDAKPATTSAPSTAKPFFGGRWMAPIAATPFALLLALMLTWRGAGTARQRQRALLAPFAKTVGSDAARERASARRSGGFRSLLADRADDRVRWAHLELLLERANVPLSQPEAIMGLIGLGSFGLLVGIAKGGFWSLLMPMLFAGLPYMVLRFKAKRRCAAFEKQLPDVLTALGSSLRVGHSFLQALAAAVADAPEPLKGEFERALSEARIGMPIEDALESMAQRLQSKEFNLVVSTVAIQRQVGGSLATMVETVCDTLRSRQTFIKKVKALTSQGRASAWVLILMPAAMAFMMNLMDSEFMRPLLHTQIGHLLIFAACVWMSIGTFFIRKIVSYQG